MLVQVGAIYFFYLFIYLYSLSIFYLLSFLLSINLSLLFIGFTLLFGV